MARPPFPLRTGWMSALCFALSIARPCEAAEGDRQAAAELFRAAEQAFARGDHVGAALTFEQAFEQAPESATAYAAATAWYKAGNLPRAADAYERALELGDLPAERKAHASSRLDELGQRLARVEITGPSGQRATVAYARARRIPFSVWVEPGSLRAVLEGAEPSTGVVTLELLAGDRRSIELASERSASSAATTTISQPPPVPERPPGVEFRPLLGWSAIGAAAISAGAAFYVRSLAVESVEDYDTSGDPEAKRRAETERDVSYVLWGAAGVLAATGITLLVWPSSDEASAGGTRVVVSPRGARLITRF